MRDALVGGSVSIEINIQTRSYIQFGNYFPPWYFFFDIPVGEDTDR